jgi:hypothetical protein
LSGSQRLESSGERGDFGNFRTAAWRFARILLSMHDFAQAEIASAASGAEKLAAFNVIFQDESND